MCTLTICLRPLQKKAGKIVKQAIKGEIDACLSSQVIYEFFAVITNHKRVACPIELEKAADLCLDLWECRNIEKLLPTPVTPNEVLRLAKELKLTKGGIFDCVMAVTAMENKVDVIYTENVSDFEHYTFVNVVNPLAIGQ